MSEQRAAALIGLAQKAGKVAGGESAALAAIRSGEAALALIAADASANSKKRFQDKAAWYGVPAVEFSRRTELGRMTGKGERSCLVITDEGLAKKIKDHLGMDDERSVV